MAAMNAEDCSTGFTNQANQEELMGRGTQVPSILVLNHFRKGTIRLPLVFRDMQKNYNSGSNWIVTADGVSEYNVFYDQTNGRLNETDVIMKALNINWFNPIILTYDGINRYKIKVFSTSGLDITNISKIAIPGQCMGNSNIVQEVEDSNSTGLSIDEKLRINNRALALSRLSMFSDGQKPVYVNIESSHIAADLSNVDVPHELCDRHKGIEHLNMVTLMLGQLEFILEMMYADGKLTFHSGWSKFVRDAGLRVGEILVMKFFSDSSTIQACVLSHTELELINCHKGMIEDVRFMSMINLYALGNGFIAIPFLVTLCLANKIGRVSSCLLPTGSVIDVFYDDNENAVYGFEDFFRSTHVEPDDVMVLHINLKSLWILQVYRKNGLGFVGLDDSGQRVQHNSYTKTSEFLQSHIDAEHLQKPEDVQVEINVADVKSPESRDDAVVLDSKNAFEIIVKSSHVDGRTHGAYVSTELAKIYKGWKNRSTATVSDGIGMWKIQLNIDKNKCRFGKGWNEFAIGANLRKGKRIRFSLIEPKKKSFMVEVEK